MRGEMTTTALERTGSLAGAHALLAQLVAAYERVAVTGRPGIGKSLVTRGLRFTPVDLLVDHGRLAEQQARAIEIARRDAWRLEGVTVARWLTRGLAAQAVLWLRGTPLLPMMTPAGIGVGDQVDTWVQEYLDTRPTANVIIWRVREPKYC